MKIRTILLLATLLPTFCYADCSPESEVANRFMNDYKNYMDNVIANKTEESTSEWLKKNANVSENFKKSYEKLVAKAIKNDPELGLDFDPILDAQDYPDQGFEILSCDEKAKLVTLKGKGWEDFHVVVKVKRVESNWLIDGAGVINIPKNKQATR